jgi:hypothetical protein
MFQGKNPKKNFYEICPTFSVISITIITHLLSFLFYFLMANWEMFCCKYNLYQLECKKFFNYWNATHLWCSESFSQPYCMYVICLWTMYKVKKIDFYSVHNIKTYLLRKPCFDLHIKIFFVVCIKISSPSPCRYWKQLPKPKQIIFFHSLTDS